jgi:hypothetical protein
VVERLRLLSSIIVQQHDDPVRKQSLDQRAPLLVRGYRLVDVDDESFQAIINEHIDNLTDTMDALLALLPPSVVVGVYAFGSEPEWLLARPREATRGILRSFGSAIAQDPNLELVVMPEGDTIPQLQLADGKVLVTTLPSSSLASFRAVVETLRMSEVPNLATIDEFPRTMMNPSGATAKLVDELTHAIESVS